MRLGNELAVNRLTATIPNGELVTLLGPSGCGKSTTLFLLAGLYKPTEGAVWFDGRNMNQTEPEKREIGMVFQNYSLYPHMTVLENISFPLKMQQLSKKDRLQQVQEISELLHIDHLLDRKPGLLSGGQQQRVAIARALVKRPKLLLLDEPLSNLDARLRIELREEIRLIQQELRITTVLVTHDQEEAMSVSDRVLLLKDGQLQQYCAPQHLYKYPQHRFVAEFIGSPPINLMLVEWDAVALQLNFPNVSDIPLLPNGWSPLPFRTGAFWMGVRAENWLLGAPKEDVWSGVVISVETMGRDTLVKVRFADSIVRAFVPAESSVQSGQRVSLEVQPKHVHWFDLHTGERMGAVT
ncbi:ATP-binding cassette domain-containing protein [Paenibacillus sp. LMG 31456]|uniref:ATP-binding cassette domain-containing protein n=2 Tax=Paenibacillus foliorum TaxID=2654974 RepID=A0A972GUF0_9BACL|nr:ATP-binding cassette domain-containing protein [Paenibacillus foliorum]